jgi:hypothetical protein
MNIPAILIPKIMEIGAATTARALGWIAADSAARAGVCYGAAWGLGKFKNGCAEGSASRIAAYALTAFAYVGWLAFAGTTLWVAPTAVALHYGVALGHAQIVGAVTAVALYILAQAYSQSK